MSNTGDGAGMRLDLESETLLEAAQRYQRPLTIGAIVLAVAIGGYWMMQRSAEIRETRAGEALGSGESAYVAGNVELAQTELEKVVTRYAGTAAGTQAALLSAQLYFEAGKVDSGMARLETAGAKAPRHLRSAVLAMQGAGHALTGRPAEAATAYERAADLAQFAADAEQNRLEAAKHHVAAGNVAAARALLQAIADREDSNNAGEARVRLGELAVRS